MAGYGDEHVIMDTIDKDVVEESTVRHTSFTDGKSTSLTFLSISRELENWRTKQGQQTCSADVMKCVELLSDDSLYIVRSNYVLLESALNQGLLPSSVLSALIQTLSLARHPSYIIRLLRKLIIEELKQAINRKDETIRGSCLITIVKTSPKAWLQVVDEVKNMFQDMTLQNCDLLIRFLSPFLNYLMMDCIDVPLNCHYEILSSILDWFVQWSTAPALPDIQVVKTSLSMIRECLHLATCSDHNRLQFLCILSRKYLCLLLTLPAGASGAHMKSYSLDLWLAYLCAMTESGVMLDNQLRLLLADSSSDIFLEMLEIRHFVSISWMLCECLLLPETVQVLLAIVTRWLERDPGLQPLWLHILFLPLLHIVSFPKSHSGLLGNVFEQNSITAERILRGMVVEVPYPTPESVSFENVCAPCVASLAYGRICAASNLLSILQQSCELQLTWMEKLIKTHKHCNSELVALVLSACLIRGIGSPHVRKAVDAVTAVALASPNMANLFIPVLFYCLQKEESNYGKFAVLQSLSQLAILQKSCLKQVMTFLMDLSSHIKLLPSVIRLLSGIWIHHDSVIYQHLFNLLSFPLPTGVPGPLLEELVLSRIVTISEMLEMRAETHGEDLLGIIVENFQNASFKQLLTPKGHALVWRLSLDALKILCKREVTNPLVLWNNIVSHLTGDSRSLVLSGVCSFIEVFTLPCWKSECDNLSRSIFKFLWNCALSEDGNISVVAWTTLNAFDLSSLKICHVPQEVCLMMGVNEGCPADEEALVSAHHIVSLLRHIPQDADLQYFKVVQKYLENECESVPRGLVSTATKQAGKMSQMKTVEEFLETLRSNLPVLAPPGVSLLAYTVFDPLLHKPQLRKLMKSSKLSFLKLLEEDPHPAESHMKEMDFLYLIKTPVDWKMFCDNLLKNFIQLELISKKEDQLPQIKQLIREDLIQTVIERNRDCPLRGDNVLHALVGLACSCQLTEDCTSPVQGPDKTYEDGKFVVEILRLLLCLSGKSTRDSLNFWSKTILEEIISKLSIAPCVIASDLTLLIKTLLEDNSNLPYLVEIEDDMYMMVEFLLQCIPQRGEGNDHDRHSLALGLLLNDIFVSSWRILPKILSAYDLYKDRLCTSCHSIISSCFIPTMLLMGSSNDVLLVLYDGIFLEWEEKKMGSDDNMVLCTILSQALLVLVKQNILSDSHLKQYIASLSALPLSHQNSAVSLIFGHQLRVLSAFGFTTIQNQLDVIIKVWIRELQTASTSVCCWMGLAGALGVGLPLDSSAHEKSCTSLPCYINSVIPLLFQVMATALTSNDAQLCGSMLYILASLSVSPHINVQEAIPQDLSYLKEDSGLRALFLVLQEESRKEEESTLSLKAELVLSVFNSLKATVPPANWSPILASLMSNGECGVQLQCLKMGLRGQFVGTKAFVIQFVTCFAVAKFPESLISICCESLDTLSVYMVHSRYGQLLFAFVEAFKNAPEETRLTILDGFLDSLKTHGKEKNLIRTIYYPIAVKLLNFISGCSDSRFHSILKKVTKYACAVEHSIIINHVREQSGTERTLAELALLSESIAVNAKDFLDWEIMRETIVCILTTKFGSLKSHMMAMLQFAICVKESLSTMDNLKHLLDIFQSVVDSLDLTQCKMCFLIAAYCLSPVTAIAPVFLLNGLLNRHDMLQPIWDTPSCFSFLLHLPVGIPDYDTVSTVVRYCLETCHSVQNSRMEMLNVVSALTCGNDAKDKATKRILVKYFME